MAAAAGYGWPVAQRQSRPGYRVQVAWTLGLVLLAAGLAAPLRAATIDAAHGPAIAASASTSTVIAAPTRARPEAAPAVSTAHVVATVMRSAADTPAVPGLASTLARRPLSDRGPPST